MADINTQTSKESEAEQFKSSSERMAEAQEVIADGLNKTISFVQANWKTILGVSTFLLAGGILIRRRFFSKSELARSRGGIKKRSSKKAGVLLQAKKAKAKMQASARSSVH